MWVCARAHVYVTLHVFWAWLHAWIFVFDTKMKHLCNTIFMRLWMNIWFSHLCGRDCHARFREPVKSWCEIFILWPALTSVRSISYKCNQLADVSYTLLALMTRPSPHQHILYNTSLRIVIQCITGNVRVGRCHKIALSMEWPRISRTAHHQNNALMLDSRH